MAARPHPSAVPAAPFVGYVRVSTDEQAESGLGLAAQRAAIEAEAKRRGYALATIFEDAGASGKSLDRPGIAAALETVATGEASGLIVAKLDRLSRSLLDFAGLVERSRREGWAIVALDLGVDTGTPAGELVANVMASVAQWERRAIGERTRAALAALRARGVRIGRPPLIDAKLPPRVRALRTRGWTLQRIADHLNAEGIPAPAGGPWDRAAVRRAAMTRRAAA